MQNAEKQLIRHTIGRQSYNNKQYKLKNMAEAKEKNMERGISSESDEYIVSVQLEEVFGSKRKDWICGYSSNVPEKQCEMVVIVCYALQKKGTQNDARLDSIQNKVGILASTVAALIGEFGSMDSKVDAILHMLSRMGSSATVVTPIVDTHSPKEWSTSYFGCANGRAMKNKVSAIVHHWAGADTKQ